MQAFMMMLLTCSATMSMIALLYMAMTPLLAKRYSAKGCYYAWLIIVIGLIIPYRPQFDHAIVKVNLPNGAVTPIAPIGNGAAIPAPALAPDMIPVAFPSISLWPIIAGIWLTGMIVFLMYHTIKHYRFVKLTGRWSERVKDDTVISILESLKLQMGISQNINVQLCASVGSPMLIGLKNPRILLPNVDFANDELCFILKHELVHYKQKDLWYKSLILFATAVHWFNPIVYLMAKAIAVQCEMSCDNEVIRSTDADIRQQYSEAIIGVIKYKSKMKTALSTNFYGGKNGMKKRICSIMDTSRKRAGATILCAVLLLTLGNGFAFAANDGSQKSPGNIQESIREDIVVSPDLSYGYRFLPDPELYETYSSYGITISSDGEMLYYNGQRVRLFVDQHSEVEAFFLDEAGMSDVSVTRNTSGNITGLEQISKEKAQEYRSVFFANDNNAAKDTKKATGHDKYQQYLAYGITLSSDSEVLYFNGQRVRLFVDNDHSFEAFWFDEAGTVNLSVTRNAAGQITSVESISEEKGQGYLNAADEYTNNALIDLEDKVEYRIKSKYN